MRSGWTLGLVVTVACTGSALGATETISPRPEPRSDLLALASVDTNPSVRNPAEVRGLHELLDLVAKSDIVQSAESTIREDEASVEAAFDPYVPDLAYDVLYKPETGSVTSGFSARVNIINRGKNINGIKVARSKLRESEYTLGDITLKTRIKAIELYHEYQFLLTRRKFIDDQIATIEATARRTKSYEQAGVAPKRVVLSMDRAVLALKRTLKSIWVEQLDNRRNLNILLGTEGGLAIRPVPVELAPMDMNWLKNLPQLKEQAWTLSFERQEIEERIDRLGTERWLAYSDQLPQLALSLNYGRFRHAGPQLTDAQQQVLESGSQEFTGGVRLHVPLPVFDFAFTLGPLRRIYAEREAKERIQHHRKRQEVERYVEHLQNRILTILDSLSNLPSYLQMMDKELADDQRRYQMGAIMPQILVRSIEDNFNERIAIKAAMTRANVDYMSLRAMTRSLEKDLSVR